ncbi:YbjN domain-containing protein [Sphingomonas aliaeris]|uniref:YbjN domain-containing protein n=1 Tax=Sphingomonas aliaeris TaxID=2759526 RepID=A0A974S4W4_9SPHN|nr:YbjN domain-containing protein [Sphingomonas aliaeris]QQV77470.1 YbjN domain-containing protein [Sphingomonas aliaeris]
MPLPFVFAALLAGATPATEPAINTHDTAMFERQLREMGYTIDPFERDGDTATAVLRSGNDKTVIVLGGCTKGDACDYLVIVSAFDDVLKPPADWVAKMNSTYDLIKVSTRDPDQALTYSAGIIIDGAPRATFRHWLERVESSSADLAQEAVKAKLVAK